MQKNKSINKEGIGLGLYITKNLAVELGGNIYVDSKESMYTKFVLTLPVNPTFRKFIKNDLTQNSETKKPTEDDDKLVLTDLQNYELQICNQNMFEQI